jgi:hypothetical protein
MYAATHDEDTIFGLPFAAALLTSTHHMAVNAPLKSAKHD